MEILRLVWSQERCAGEIARCFRVTFGAISQHLGRLAEAGLLSRRRQGRSIFYLARREALGPLAAALEAMWKERLGALKTLAETEQRRIDAGRSPGRRSTRKGNR